MNKRDMQKIPELIDLLDRVTQLIANGEAGSNQHNKLRRMIRGRLKFFSQTNMISPYEYSTTTQLAAGGTSKEIALIHRTTPKTIKRTLTGMVDRLDNLYKQYEAYKKTKILIYY